MIFQPLLLLTFLLVTKCSAQPSIIIVGAGPSGVAAASRLLENNFSNITVLEAENRIGGRIFSVKFGDAYVDLGAHWCHGEKDNAVYNLVKDLNLVEHTSGDSRILYSSGVLDDDFNDELLSFLGRAFDLSPRGVRVSVEEYYLGYYNKSAGFKFGNNARKFRVATATGRLLAQLILAHRGSFSLDDVIVERDYKICEGDLRLNWNGAGYRTILDVMLKKIPDESKQLPFEDKLLLNKEVSNVSWDGKSVTVTCIDGSQYSADHVIFTPSVGVLKHDHETLFTPQLPEDKIRAIKQIGLGAIADFSLHFPSRWWPTDNFTGYYFVWDENDIQNLREEKNGSSWLADLFNVIPTEKNPNVLTFWVTGTSVPEVEKLSDEELINGTLNVLKRFLGNQYNVTEPDSLIRSRWFTNPHFRGVYSYQTKEAHESRPSAEVVLSQPLQNDQGRLALLFAGEATHPHYYSTVHGAIETGYREADRLINSYNTQL